MPKCAVFGTFGLLINLKRSFMNDLGKRTQDERKRLNLTQAQLADKVGISHTQMARYEIKEVQPPADVLQRLSDLFGVTIDFLVNGNIEEKAKNTLQDAELLQQFKEVEKMNDDDRLTVKKLIDAFITKGKLKQLVL